jgi:hypothetical protein
MRNRFRALDQTKKIRAASTPGDGPRRRNANTTRLSAATRYAPATKRRRGRRETIAEKSGVIASVTPSVTRNRRGKSRTLPTIPTASRTGRTAYQAANTQKKSANDQRTSARALAPALTRGPCARPR